MFKRLFEKYLLVSRWLLAPFFVMLTVALFALMLKAARRTIGLLSHIFVGNDEHVTLEILNLIDITLTGALVVIVTISVYENFVSQVSQQDHKAWPDWMGNIDFSQLKLKLLTTIVAISAIKLLEAFMDVTELSDREIYFYMTIHVVFVVSTLAFAVAERLSSGKPGHGGPQREA